MAHPRQRRPRPAWLTRFAGPHAFSPWVGLVVLGPLTFGTALADTGRQEDAFAEWILLALIASAVSFGVFILMGTLTRGLPVGGLRSALVAVLFGLVEAGRAVLIEWMASAWGMPSEAGYAYRLVAGFATGVALFSLASVLVGDSLTYRTEVRTLREQEGKLRQLLTRTVADRAAVRTELLRDVRETVNVAIRELLRPGKLGSSAQEVVDTLVEVSDGVIRPMSHDLHNRPRLYPEPLPEASLPRIRWQDAVAQITLVGPFQPVRATVFGLLMAAPAILFAKDFLDGVLGLLDVVGSLVVVLTLGYLIARWTFTHIPAWLRAAIMTLIFGAMGATVGFLFGTTGYWPETDWSAYAYTSLIAIVVLWMLAIPPGLQVARQAVLEETTRVNDSLRWELARANAQMWQDQQELSSVLHRDIQGTLLASAFRLKQAIEQGGDTTAVIDEIRTILEDSAQFVVESSGPKTLHAVFADISERWDGVLAVQPHYSSATRKVVEDDPVALRAIRDLSGEFATNSLKHGRASHMSVDIEMADSRTLLVSLSNDGRPLDDNVKPGLGSRLINAIATNVTYSSHDIGVTVSLTLPVGGSDSSRTEVPTTARR